MQDKSKSLWLGLLAVTLFALTLPMTKLAMGAHGDGLSPWFVAFARAAGAGLLSVIYLFSTKALWPNRSQLYTLILMSTGNVFGFPILQSLGLIYVPSSHAAVFNGVLPLFTAVMSAIIFKQRASLGFWLCAILGGLIVVAFAILRTGNITLDWADVLLISAVIFCAFGYAQGAKLAKTMPAAQALCWMLVISLPITLPASWVTYPDHIVSSISWWAFAYVTLFSMWLGMMIWYYALNLGGAVRISQIQLLQPFLSMVFAIPLLNEQVSYLTWLFAVAVVLVAYIGKKMPVYAETLSNTQTKQRYS